MHEKAKKPTAAKSQSSGDVAKKQDAKKVKSAKSGDKSSHKRKSSSSSSSNSSSEKDSSDKGQESSTSSSPPRKKMKGERSGKSQESSERRAPTPKAQPRSILKRPLSVPEAPARPADSSTAPVAKALRAVPKAVLMKIPPPAVPDGGHLSFEASAGHFLDTDLAFIDMENDLEQMLDAGSPEVPEDGQSVGDEEKSQDSECSAQSDEAPPAATAVESPPADNRRGRGRGRGRGRPPKALLNRLVDTPENATVCKSKKTLTIDPDATNVVYEYGWSSERNKAWRRDVSVHVSLSTKL